MLKFVICGKFHFGHRDLETPKTSKFVPKKWILLGSKARRTWGHEGAALWVKAKK